MSRNGYYTSTIPIRLARKLVKAGMKNAVWHYQGTEQCDCQYGEVFDWFLKKGISIEITRFYDFANEIVDGYEYSIVVEGTIHKTTPNKGGYDFWKKAANDAIVAAIDYFKKK